MAYFRGDSSFFGHVVTLWPNHVSIIGSHWNDCFHRAFMLSSPPTTEIAFFAVIKYYHQKQLLEETGGRGITSPYRLQSMRGSGGMSSRQTLEAGAKTEAAEEWGLLICSMDCSACFFIQPRSTFLVAAPSTFVLVLLQHPSLIEIVLQRLARPVEAFLSWSSLFLDDLRLCRLTGNSTVAYTGSDWFTLVWFLLECCSSEENNQEKAAQTTRSLRKM